MGDPDLFSFPCPLTPSGLPDPALLDTAREHPVVQVLAPGGKTVWLVSGHELVREVLSDPTRFTSKFDPGFADNTTDMVLLDPPEHTRMRKLAARAFSSRQIQELLPQIEAQVERLLDTMARSGPPADLVKHVSLPLPAEVMGIVLGIPETDRGALYRWVDPFTAAAPATSEAASQAADGAELEGMYTYVSRLVKERIQHPGNDLLSQLISARNDGDQLTEEELVATVALMIVAGQETTCKSITRGVLVLAGSDHWSALAAGAIDSEAVIEEVLRHQSPIDTSIFRAATLDTELGGQRIRAGEQLFVSLQMANFDPVARKRPEVFDPCRADQGHVSFGYGPHFCLGAGLARVELKAVFTAMASRFPGLRMAVDHGQLTWSSGLIVNAPSSLPVTW
jgi:nocardicin N-oxygenase